MPDLQILFWARSIERLLIVVFSGMSLVLGWNLFRVGVLDPQAAELSTKSWKIKLQRVGPGAFFALFAVVGFIYSVAHPLNWNAKEYLPAADSGRVSEVQESKGSMMSKGDADVSALREREITAINTIEKVAIPKSMPGSSSREREALQEALEQLQMRRDQLLFETFGPAARQYKALGDKALGDPSALAHLSKDERKNYEKLQALRTDTFLQE